MSSRRKRIALLVLIVCCLSLAGCAKANRWPELAQGVTGRVFLDANANGRYDAGDEGLAGVPVTDGLAFVRTGPDGRYRIRPWLDSLIQIDKMPILSVSFPNGTWPTSGWFRRLDDVKDLANVDFPLRADKQKTPFLFIHGSDPHVPRGGKDKFAGFLRDMRGLADRARFCVMTGDLVDLSDSHSFAKAALEFALLEGQIRHFPMPLFCVPGNHDAAGVTADKKSGWTKDDPAYAYGYYREVVGPLRWSFNYAGIHFVGIDFLRVDAEGKWQHGQPPSAIEWLRQDLAQVKPGSRIFLFLHAPRGKSRDPVPKPTPELPPDLLAACGVTRIFAGHTHRDSTGEYGTTPLTESGSISEIFDDADRKTGYRLVYVTRDGLDMFYRETGASHAITLDFPRHKGTIKPGDVIRGAFYDPDSKIKKLTVKVGDVQADVPFKRGPVCCRFEAKLDLARVPTGKQKLQVTLGDGKKTWRYEHDYEVAAADTETE